MDQTRKLKLTNAPLWPHHRGGWTAVVNIIHDELRADDGTRFISAVEDVIADGEILTEPWVGFVHQVPRTTLKWYPDLERLLRHPGWQQSLPFCRGIYTLSGYIRDYLLEQRVPVPVAHLLYPAEETEQKFSFERYRSVGRPIVLFVGEYLRNPRMFYELPATDHRKIILAPEKVTLNAPNSVEVMARVTDERYDDLLSRSVVFLNLIDAPANTTVVECIVRNTPILINPLPGVVEYLGADYPLYYGDIAEAESKLQDSRVLAAAEEYLRALPIKEQLTAEAFVNSITASAIYKGLPLPQSQQDQFKSFDITILICSYKRVYNIKGLLKAFSEQNFSETYEIIIWNNNINEKDAIDKIVKDFTDLVNIKIIHSSVNYYCIVRPAIAQLMRSDILLICDDDVVPTAGYIDHFVTKYAEYGPDVVLCARGHVFRPHQLNEENPAEFWENYQHMKFYDESVDDRQVHFMHADNCLIPKHILKQVGLSDLPAYEYALIDDYWMSYVLSHELKIPLWKIRADGVLSFTPCSEDPNIALFQSAQVREQRVRFYVHHMRAGWPPAEKVVEDTQRARPHRPPMAADPWESGFAGVNMFSEAPEDDFRAAADYGVTVIRVGAVGGAGDLRYLVNDSGEVRAEIGVSQQRLKTTIAMAQKYGMKIILAPSHLPGRLFTTRGEQPDLRMWAGTRFRSQIVALWSDLARELRGVKEIIGYDLINEPFTPEDTSVDFLDYTPSASDRVLADLYRDTVVAIREHDRTRPIVLEAPCWANPLALSAIHPLPNQRIFYSFHMYTPHRYTMRAQNRGRYSYPGRVPRWPNAPAVEPDLWDKSKIERFLGHVVAWQSTHGISSHQIFVGEFGVTRDSLGAAAYLTDLTAVFRQNDWRWCLYAFRDDAWDAMDYELSDDLGNMLYRRRNSLFDVVASQFR